MSEITHEEVAFRLVRALRLDTAMRDDDRLVQRAKSNWPAYMHDRADLNCQAENAIWLKQVDADAARLRSWDNKGARDDFLEVMDWITEVTRLTQPTLDEDEQAKVRAYRRMGLGYEAIARRIGRSPRAVGLFLGVKREMAKRDGKLSNVQFIRRVSWDWDFESIAKRDSTNADGAKRRWVDLVALCCDVANGRIGLLRAVVCGAGETVREVA